MRPEAVVLEVLGPIYEAVIEPKGWSAVVEALEQIFGGAAVVVGLPHPGPDSSGELLAGSIDPAFLASYRDQFVYADPFLSHFQHLPVGCFEFGRALVPDAEFEKTTFHREWMTPQGLLPVPSFLGVVERSWEHGTVALRVFRRRGMRPFGVSQQRLGALLMPHLKRAVRTGFARSELTAQQGLLASLFDRSPAPLILVNGRGRVQRTNRAAERLLARRDGLTLGRDGLGAASVEETATLRHLLAEAARPLDGGSWRVTRTLRLSRPAGGRPLNARIVSVPLPSRIDGYSGTAAALLVSDPEGQNDATPEVLQGFYDLTPAEAALASELAAGQSLGDAANHLRIARETARTHLKQIFAKTETCRQVELVRQVLSDLPLLGLDDPEIG